MLDKKFIQEHADRLIFALDTGTRSVVGALGLWEGEVFTVIDYEQHPHKTRAMRDGQIEDIGQVAQAIQAVKTALEQRWDVKLTRASIAAAGRALKTVTAEFEQDIPIDAPITGEQIRSIEYGAISAALDLFCQDDEENSDDSTDHSGDSTDRSDDSTDRSDDCNNDHNNRSGDCNDCEIAIQPSDFSCVGYSVSGYWLDGYPISNLEGHRGKRMKTGVIAAFLPQSVVRSLYAATSQCGLQVSSLTLEPIAAIQAIVPGDLRLLNLAIVDIGAGTSDIAVTQNGSVVAYDMVTLAGDEITEALMHRCLTDFDTAEQIKLALCKKNSEKPTSLADRKSTRESIPFTDILGNACSIDISDVMEAIEPATEALCSGITDCITQINGAPPAAVFLIGGGSQLEGLACRVAAKLGLPENRVALGGTRPYPHIRVCSEQLLSPEFVTPLGIGAVSTLIQENDYLSVQINQQKVMIPGTGSIKIIDALLLAGIRSSSLMGRTPPSLVFYKNNQPQTYRSTPSLPGELYCNGIPATLNTQIRQGDQITLIPAKNGVAPQIYLADICEFKEDVICTVNGLPCAPDYRICPQDDVRIFSPKPAAQPQTEASESSAVRVSADDQEPARQLRIQLNGQWITVDQPAAGSLYFVDLLNYVNIDPKKPNGNPVLLLNEREAAYLDPINDGDRAEIRWSGEKNNFPSVFS